MTYVPLIFCHVISHYLLVNALVSRPLVSEKSLSPLVDDTQPFTVPFRPYAWDSPPGPRHLLQQQQQQGLTQNRTDLDRSPGSVGFYGDRSPVIYPEDGYGDYRRHTAALLFPEAKGHEAKSQTDVLRSSLILNGAFKCVKCSKVRRHL